MGKIIFYRYMLSVSIFLCGGCKADMVENYSNGADDRVLYFESFSGYKIPLNLVGQITKEESLSKKSFYVGYYGKDGQLQRVEKYYDGVIFFAHDYEYYASGSVKTSTVKNKDGVVTLNSFDDKATEKGKP